jgi:hypothetical protein
LKLVGTSSFRPALRLLDLTAVKKAGGNLWISKFSRRKLAHSVTDGERVHFQHNHEINNFIFFRMHVMLANPNLVEPDNNAGEIMLQF